MASISERLMDRAGTALTVLFPGARAGIGRSALDLLCILVDAVPEFDLDRPLFTFALSDVQARWRRQPTSLGQDGMELMHCVICEMGSRELASPRVERLSPLLHGFHQIPDRDRLYVGFARPFLRIASDPEAWPALGRQFCEPLHPGAAWPAFDARKALGLEPRPIL